MSIRYLYVIGSQQERTWMSLFLNSDDKAYEPVVIPSLSYVVSPERNLKETSQWLLLVKASWRAPLICPLAKEKGGQLDSIENRDVVQRVSELEAGACIGNANLSLNQCHCLHGAPAPTLSCTSWKTWVETPPPPLLDGARVTPVPAGDGSGRKTSSESNWKRSSSLSRLWAVWFKLDAFLACTALK